ncbi:hypothetical protein J7U46_20700 [Pelomonas sp. V22]|uniref:4'-phosphopantetheinyl transferase family protein n=1 Tax=Pelomonas sp. V22 TaxID=2822139 RepID=UPI0024A7E216|nr:hypothetical protein [Pelomonas sp. V22]MDI4635496.1 hypothetical protein [Pelomonas sp. V22]
MSWACITPLAEVLSACPEPATWFSPAEQARWTSFAADRRRQQFMAGRWLARLLLARVRGGQPGDHPLTQLEDGRCLAPPPWQLSISHSDGWVGVAIADGGRLGLDLQLESSTRDWSALAAFAGLQPCPDAACFYRHWTLAEAWLKAHAERIASLTELRGLRWQAAATGPAWQGRVAELHWALVGSAAPCWVTDLLPGSLQPQAAECWSPLSAA